MHNTKKIRLNRARDFMLDKRLRVNEAAMQVGYESPTQFSREFKDIMEASK